MKKKPINSKLVIKMKISLSPFFLESKSNKFDNSDAKEGFLKHNVYDLSVDYNAINKSNIFVSFSN